MIILKGILAIAILFIIPLLLGFIFLNFIKDEKNNLFFGVVIGYIVEFAICQLLAVPMIFEGASFTTLLCIYLIIIGILSVISIILNRKRIKEICTSNLEKIKDFPKVLTVIAFILILVQMYAFVGYAHIDEDDAFYVGTATTTVQTDTLYKYSPTTGEENVGDHLSVRYRVAPFPIFTAIISKVISIHPAIVAHVVIPVIFIAIVYTIYGLIANEIFNKNKKNVILFLVIMSMLHIWGNYSIRNNYTFLLFRIWQGKAVLANIIIPSTILLFIKLEKSEYSFINLMLILIVILAGNFTTTMGIGMPPIVLMVLCMVYEFFKFNFKDLKNNNYKLAIKNFSKCLACCIPSIVYGLIYFINL